MDQLWSYINTSFMKNFLWSTSNKISEIKTQTKRNHVRCLAHIINLTSQKIIKHFKAASKSGRKCDFNGNWKLLIINNLIL